MSTTTTTTTPAPIYFKSVADVTLYALEKNDRIIATFATKVLDLTPFVDDHPGGGEVLTDLKITAGGQVKDAKEPFDSVSGHGVSARKQVDDYVIGKIDASATGVEFWKSATAAAAGPAAAAAAAADAPKPKKKDEGSNIKATNVIIGAIVVAVGVALFFKYGGKK
jgi:hypothetical protein